MVTSHQTFSHGFLNRYQLDGIDVISFYIPYSQKFGSVARYLSFAIFSLFAFIVSLFLDFDIIYASSTPLTIALPALLLSNVKHKSFFFEIRDLWPEVPIKLGILRNKSVIFLSRLLERTALKITGIVALSPSILDYVSKFSLQFLLL